MAMMLIDTSSAQGHVDWVRASRWVSKVTWPSWAVGERVEGAICKVNEGNSDKPDPQFVVSWSGIAAVGLPRGGYHFAHPDVVHAHDGADEAQRCWAIVEPQGFRRGVDFLALDVEEARGVHAGHEFTEWVVEFLETLTALSGMLPLVYTGGPFWNAEQGTPDPALVARLSAFPLWLAAYVLESSLSRFVPAPWHSVGPTLWQRTGDLCASDAGLLYVDGIGDGRVHVDRSLLVRGATSADFEAIVASLVTPTEERVTPTEPIDPGVVYHHGTGSTLAEDVHALPEPVTTPPDTLPSTPTSKSSERIPRVDAPIVDGGKKEGE